MIAWGAKVSPDFRNKAISICADLGIPPDWLMACMYFESGLSASIKNKAGSGAVGLIQFMPSTAKALGTSTALLAAMSGMDQLAYVWKYFEPYVGRLDSLEDCYMTILWPRAVGKPSDYVLFNRDEKPTTYRQNGSLDSDKDGNVTKWEASNHVRRALRIGLKPENIG